MNKITTYNLGNKSLLLTNVLCGNMVGLITVNKNDNLQAGNKASRVKTLTSKSDSLGSTTMTHTVEGETQLLQTVLWLPHRGGTQSYT